MLEYNIDEAEKMLNKNLESASKTLETVEDDLGFLKDQYVTTEVSILFRRQFNLPNYSVPRYILH